MPYPSSEALTAATLSFQDSTPYAEQFGDVYHSNEGGLAQARHVFLSGNDLPGRWQGRAEFSMLETGFGLGLNFLATWQAWRADPLRCRRLHYTSIEKYPFHAADLAQLHARWPELDAFSVQLRAQWPALTAGAHRLLLDEGQVELTLVLGDVADCLPRLDLRCAAFYLDGFAPAKNPGMWAPPVLSHLHKLALPGATLATFSAAGPVRQALRQAGFVCKRRPGFGSKWHMLAARFSPEEALAQSLRSVTNG
ncbi:tRNA (5-methylaminomethyl-2-thiouridine)(34)-methyltransferase MnmD [Massilia sp. NR 4-1]|uniref:tRNA (5-methylaminomethyl-2-thiouridine)(34)-methyltransferase MnmD n=1 Tax=Massilia sp. NR 4-1 TaxID=1678028 RepID=UPI00067B09B4|nr:tRNA (5-methylaminomethyl-2-thiouridine)(34)-methyltransferase MnmD [Massilia sp. NR 4-1]